MKLLFTAILVAAFGVMSAFAEGISSASYRRDCLPRLRAQPELMRAASAFDVLDIGQCLTTGTSIEFPFIFAARPKGSNGEYNILLVIDYAYNLGGKLEGLAGSSSPREGDTKYGIALWSRSHPGDDPFARLNPKKGK